MTLSLSLCGFAVGRAQRSNERTEVHACPADPIEKKTDPLLHECGEVQAEGVGRQVAGQLETHVKGVGFVVVILRERASERERK